MKKNSGDRRVRKTKKALQESLAVLMENKNIREISVQELTELADLNRATFYLHYKDIYDLQQQLENEIIAEIHTILAEYITEKNEPKTYPLFIALLTYIKDNSSIWKMLINKNNNRTFLDKLCVIVEERVLHNWLNTLKIEKESEELLYFSSYIVYGYVATLAKWVESGMQTPPEKLAEMMGNFGLYGIGLITH